MKTFIHGTPTNKDESYLKPQEIKEVHNLGEVAIEMNRILSVWMRGDVATVYQEGGIAWHVCLNKSPQSSVESLKQIVERGKK